MCRRATAPYYLVLGGVTMLVCAAVAIATVTMQRGCIISRRSGTGGGGATPWLGLGLGTGLGLGSGSRVGVKVRVGVRVRARIKVRWRRHASPIGVQHRSGEHRPVAAAWSE